MSRMEHHKQDDQDCVTAAGMHTWSAPCKVILHEVWLVRPGMTLKLKVSERRACRVPGQHRSTQRKIARSPDDEAALTADITALALQYGRYGYRRIRLAGS